MRLSNLELLFVALAISALIYFSSLGPGIEDPWMKARIMAAVHDGERDLERLRELA
jgi:hypothetical protein